MKNASRFTFALAFALGLATESYATVVQTNSFDSTSQTAFGLPAPATNLALGATLTQTNGSSPVYGVIGNLNDGTLGGATVAGDIVAWDFIAGPIVQFDLGGNPGGYNVSELSVYAGWQDDSRVNQNFRVLYSVPGNPSFSELGSYSYEPTISSGNFSTKVELTDDSGNLLSGIDSIAIEFNDNGFDNKSAYREVAIVGVAVPEPTSLALLTCGAVALFWFRGRRS